MINQVSYKCKIISKKSKHHTFETDEISLSRNLGIRLILTYWEFVISMWEAHSILDPNTGCSLRAIQSHNLTNQFDQNLIIKSESDIAKLSTNQLKLWLANYLIIEKINKLENKTG